MLAGRRPIAVRTLPRLFACVTVAMVGLPACSSRTARPAPPIGTSHIYLVAVTKRQVPPCQVDEPLFIRILKDATGPALPVEPSPIVYTAHEIVLSPNQMAQAGDPRWAWENWCGPSGPAYVVAASAPGSAPRPGAVHGLISSDPIRQHRSSDQERRTTMASAVESAIVFFVNGVPMFCARDGGD